MFSVKSSIYLDTNTQEYIRVLNLSSMPPGPLSAHVVRANNNTLSLFESREKCRNKCLNLIISSVISPSSCNKYLVLDDLDDLIVFLEDSKYVIKMELTDLLQRNRRVNDKNDIIFYVSPP